MTFIDGDRGEKLSRLSEQRLKISVGGCHKLSLLIWRMGSAYETEMSCVCVEEPGHP